MKFGEFPLSDVEGAILAHSHRLPERALKKGRRLNTEDIALLRTAGYKNLVCAKIEEGDILEDDAANQLAGAVAGPMLSKAVAFTGRCNLFAEVDGLVIYDPQRLNGFNLVDESITLGVVPPYQNVTKGQMVATLKIIPFALPNNTVQIAQSIAETSDHLIRVAPFRALKVAMVQSRLEGTKESVLDSTNAVTEARLRALGCTLTTEVRCAHDETSVSRAIAEVRGKGVDLVLVSGASAVVDRRDVVPASIEKAGGVIDHFGMPVDPGNLMLMGRIDGTPIIGMPGCARSPKLNGFDWVLERIVAGVPAGSEAIMRMGAGGLLKDVAARPLPRAKARPGAYMQTDMPEETTQPSRAPRIAALVLAAGQSRRMGRNNKLLAEIDGIAMVRRTAENILQSRARPVIAVTGHERERTEATLDGLDLSFAHNTAYADGLSTSMKAGIAALDEDVDGILVCLGDMPRVSPETVDKLISAFDPLEGRAICVPTWRGKRGNPVLWARRFFEEMMDVSGDVGARHLIGTHGELVVEVEMKDDGVMIDVDTPDALAKLNAASGAKRSV
jgi:molybdenum cofactor cytidylyltransferase